MKREVAKLTKSQYAIHALDWIFGRPIFRSPDFISAAGIPPPTARRFLGVLRDGDVLKVVIPGSGSRPAVFSFPALLDIAESRETI